MGKAILNLEGKSAEQQAIAHLSRLVWDAHGVALEKGNRWGLCDQIDNAGQPYQSAWAEKWLRYAIDVVSAVDGLPDVDALPPLASE